jgi:putative ABC transport system permease protein
MQSIILIIKSIIKNAKVNTIVIMSMALGLLAAGIILSYVYQEFHYDTVNKNSQNVYRIVGQAGELGPMAETLKSNFPEIKKAIRISFFYGYLACSTEEKKFNETSAIFTDPGFFNLFSFPLIKGNSKTCLLEPNSIVLSQTSAQKYFNDDNPIGKQFKIGTDKEYTVTGVFRDFETNSNFRGDLVFPLEEISKLTQIWIEPSWEHGSDIHTFVLLDDHANLNELSGKIEKLISQYVPQADSKCRFQPLKDIHVENQILWESTSQANVTNLYILVGIAILILIISGSNFLFLFIGIKSQKRISAGIKKVCGASKLDLFIEYFTEVLILMTLSVLSAGVLFTFYHIDARDYFNFLPNIVFFDYKLFFILLTVIASVALLSGLYPALVLSSNVPIRIFSSQYDKVIGKVKFVNKLIIVQFTLCITMIIGTMLMHKQLNFMENKNTGYAKDELVTIPLNMHIGDGIYNEKFGAFSNELKNYPGIKNVTMAFSSPSSINPSGDTPPDWHGKPEGKQVNMHWESVSYDYFKTIGVEVLEGRSFNPDFPADKINWDNHCGSFILNKSAVKAMEIDDPIGKEFKVWGFKGPIIGVVNDYNFQSMRSSITPMFFMVNPIFFNEIIIRITPNSALVLAGIKTVWDHFVPEYPLEFHFVSDQVRKLYYSEKSLAKYLKIFSVLAIVIASMGLFALTLLSTNQRIKEIGVRKVVGASISGIVFLLSKDYIKLVIIANVIAWPVAWLVMNQWLQNYAYRISMQWWMFLAAGGVAIFIAVLTVSWQAFRAARANPVEALKYE